MIKYSDLAEKAYKNNTYIFTDFLSLSEQEDLYSESRDFSYIKFELIGGYDDAERKIAKFGSADAFGYDEDAPIVCLKISPLGEKFAKEVSHRDYLGTLMNLGLERKCFGDIIVSGKSAYVFVLERISDYVIDNTTRIANNPVMVSRAVFDNNASSADGKIINIQVASMRCDALIAKAFDLSRKDAAAIFFEKKVAVDGRLVENNDHNINGLSTISVRGFGKFKIINIGGTTKKGKQIVTIEKYGK